MLFWGLIMTDLATSGLCLTASRRGSVLMRIAQQGKQASSRIRIPLWRITPTRFKLPLPYVYMKQVDRYSNKQSQKTPNHTNKQGFDWSKKTNLRQKLIVELFVRGPQDNLGTQW